MDNELKQINEILANKVPAIINDEYQKKFDSATFCWICNKPLENDKVWDHCHITGKFRVSAHSNCNLQLKIEPWKIPIPIIFHNFRGYDSHIVCQSIAKSASAHQIHVIAETFERYKSMRVGQLKYIDSYQFMNSSIATLAENLGAVKCNDENCKHFYRIDKGRCFGTLKNHKITMQIYKNYTQEQIALLCRKGVYPYEYINSFDRFLETELPSIEKFYSRLSRSNISQEDYEHAQKVWKTFGCKNLGNYHDIYLKTDVLLLADVWTKF